MKLSLVLTVHNRTPDVSWRVADSFSLAGNRVDETIVVLDRPTPAARDGALAAYASLPSVSFVNIVGEPAWICPAKAWNAGYEAATGDLLYCISSEVVQDAGNVERAREICRGGDVALFGACHNSTAEQLVVGAEPGLLVSSAMPRPLGFIACVPTLNMRQIGGNDLGFMSGAWYEDDDLYIRLWRTGLDFVFNDSIHGIHLHHDRPVLATAAGQAMIQRNATYMARKHGTLQPWMQTKRLVYASPGETTWRHP